MAWRRCGERKKKLEILRCMRSHPNFLPSAESPESDAPPTHSLVYCNRRSACEGLVVSCDAVSVEMCVRKRWFMMGVWWEWRVMSCYCRRCHKMFVSSPPNGSVYSSHPTNRGDSAEESSTPPLCVWVSVMRRGIHWQIGCLKSQPRL